MPVATYPGTVTPLRGLSSFVESERDVFFGRDREREELARLVTGDGFRAGLLYGESGVGKSSLLQAGLLPDLRDHGITALFCADNNYPLMSLAQSLQAITGQSPREREEHTGFLSRVIADAGQIFILIFDGIEEQLGGDERVVTELGELFTRVASRAAGRARFLFSCASEEVHRFGALEKRTGSLFPAQSRFELKRMTRPSAQLVLERTIQLAPINCGEDVAPFLMDDLVKRGPVLPADLQIAAQALKDLAIQSAAQLQTIGGFHELEGAWLKATAESTGNGRSAMRLLGELSSGDPTVAYPAADIAARACVDQGFAQQALALLQGKSLVQAMPVQGTEELHYRLSHPILAPRIREHAALAKQSAQRAFELLGAKAANKQRLTVREYLSLKQEGIVPGGPEEQAVVDRTLMLGKAVAIGVVAVPILILLIGYFTISGGYYLDTSRNAEGLETIVVRAGSPGGGLFKWLPASPSFDSIVADTGLTRSMVTDKAWKKASANDYDGELDDGDYGKKSLGYLTPHLERLTVYAATGDESVLADMRSEAQDSRGLAQLIGTLAPIARGGSAEQELVREALGSDSAAARTEALNLAVSANQRKPGTYAELLAEQLASPKDELRHLALSAAKGLPRPAASELIEQALARDPDANARRELVALLSDSQPGSGPSIDAAVSLLLNEEVSQATRETSHALMRRAMESRPAESSDTIAGLMSNGAASSEDRVYAIELLLEHAPEDSYMSLASAAEQSAASEDLAVRAAALPLLARTNSMKAVNELAILTNAADTPVELRVATALAWGEVARTDESNRSAAQAALSQLLDADDRKVRGAAARAYGYLGRSAQATLSEMVKKDYIDVAENAAYGLANSADVGAPVGNAVGGIRQLWKTKGRNRSIAAEVFARMARTKPFPIFTYLTTAARSKDDEKLHAIGARGLCNAHKAGHGKAARELARLGSNPLVAVRKIVIQCVVDHGDDAAAALAVASTMVDDSSGDIRLEVARVIAAQAGGEVAQERVGKLLARLAKDSSRGVRIVAVRALSKLDPSLLPENINQSLSTTFEKADEGEKLAILEVSSQLGIGELPPLAISDASSTVRMAALDAAIATRSGVAPLFNSALADPDTGVRRNALERLADNRHGLGPDAISKALALAVRDEDPGIADLAMMTDARLGAPDEVAARLGQALASRSEHDRAKAAAASSGLAGNAPEKAIELLEPLLSDSSHDVRSEMLEPLASAYAATMSTEELIKRLKKSEKRANRRLAVTAALLLKASGEGASEVTGALEAVVKKGPPMAAVSATLALGLIEGKADSLIFLENLVP